MTRSITGELNNHIWDFMRKHIADKSRIETTISEIVYRRFGFLYPLKVSLEIEIYRELTK